MLHQPIIQAFGRNSQRVAMTAVFLVPFLVGACRWNPELLPGLVVVHNSTDGVLQFDVVLDERSIIVELNANEGIAIEVRQGHQPYHFCVDDMILAGREVPVTYVVGEISYYETSLHTITKDPEGIPFAQHRYGYYSINVGGFDSPIFGAVYLFVNVGESDIGVGSDGGGSLLQPGQHVSIRVKQGTSQAIDVETFRRETNLEEAHETLEVSAPAGDGNPLAAYLVRVMATPEVLELDVQPMLSTSIR